ncbi:MAG: tripartite tricarboxylate transporter substrate-binding protein [Betaproteobacteria bacterium]
MPLARVLAIGCAALFTSFASAQIWQGGQPLRIIVPFPGGASTMDSVVRTLTPEISKAIGVPVIVDNRPGAGTVIGVDATAKATDGRTVGAVANSFTVNQTLVKNLPYDASRDLQPVVFMARTANVLAVRANLPVNTLPELIAFAKQVSLVGASNTNDTKPEPVAVKLYQSTSLDVDNCPFIALPSVTASAAASVLLTSDS